MTDSPTSVRHILSQPEAGTPQQPGDKWQKLHDRLSEERKGFKLVALPDLVEKAAELLDIEVPDLLLASWRKCNQLQAALAESREKPETKMYVGLAEHTITSTHHPSIEARIGGVTAKPFIFTLQLHFKLIGCELEIQAGAIKRAKTGSCEIEGTFAYDELVLMQKKMAPIRLPGSIPVGDQ
jgi:hypothetical protein